MNRLERTTEAVRRAIARAAPHARRGAESARGALATTRGRVVAAVGAVALVVLVVAISGGGDGAAPGGEGGGDRAGRKERANLPRPVSTLLDEMSTQRKVAQLMLVGPEGTDTGDPVFSALEERDYAGLVLEERNYESSNQVADLADEAVSVAEDADHVTPWVMASQEGGEFNAFGDLPPEDAAADTASPREAKEAAEAAAEALEEIGITGVLGPGIDVGTESGGALEAQLYSDDPEQVENYGLAKIEAYEDAGLFSAAKHFPGLGAASQSPEVGSANVGLSLDQLAERDLIPFEAAIKKGVPGIVVGHGLYSTDDFVTPASASEEIMTDLLRDDLGFEGVAITDDLTAPAITGAFTPADAAVDAVESGADMVQVSVDDEEQRDVYDALLTAVRRERISPRRLDEAVTRTLVAKERAGLVEAEEGDGGGGDGGRGGGGGGGGGGDR